MYLMNCPPSDGRDQPLYPQSVLSLLRTYRYPYKKQETQSDLSPQCAHIFEDFFYLGRNKQRIVDMWMYIRISLRNFFIFRLFQEFYGLKQTGRINKKAVKIMKEPRCGLPDTRLSDPMSTIRDFHVYHYCGYLFFKHVFVVQYFVAWTLKL